MPLMARATNNADGAPLFRILEEEPLRPKAMVAAGLVASLMLAIVAFLMSRTGWRLAGYLFAQPTALYDPRGEAKWARPVAGNGLANKPVYVLTSGRTISAAEQLCYNLKMLRRATQVGEKTAGSAHAGVFHRIDDHYGMGIPEVQAKNPYGSRSWEGVGVEPDVRIDAEALPTAEKLAENGPKKNKPRTGKKGRS